MYKVPTYILHSLFICYIFYLFYCHVATHTLDARGLSRRLKKWHSIRPPCCHSLPPRFAPSHPIPIHRTTLLQFCLE